MASNACARALLAAAVLAALGACGVTSRPSVSAPARSGDSPATQSAGSEAELRDVCVGQAHSCVLASDGRVACWGSNGFHQAAPEDEPQLDAPRWLSGIARARALSCGPTSTCVLTDRGAVSCWGAHYSDQTLLGVDSPRNQGLLQIDLPRPALALVSLAHGGCAILDDHHLSCWTEDSPHTSFSITGIDDAETFATAASDAAFACLVRSHALPTCVKFSGRDPLNPSAGFPFHLLPLPGLAGAEQLILTQDSLVCSRGANNQCFTSGGVARPDPFAGTHPDAFLATNGPLACLRFGTRMRCFASDGDSYLATDSAHVTALALSRRHACAIVSGHAQCWGRAQNGQLGDGARHVHPPELVPNIADATSVVARDGVTCVARKSDRVSCWGRSESWPVLENAPVIDVPTPTLIDQVTLSARGTPCIRVGKADTCWDGSAWQPRSEVEEGAVPSPAFAGIHAVSTSADQSCVVDSHGRLGCTRCVGCAASPKEVIWQSGDFRQAASFGADSDRRLGCALTKDERLECFQPDSHGSQWQRIDWPKAVELDGVVDLRAASSQPMSAPAAQRANLACALTHAGQVTCWGDPWLVRLGDPSTAKPLPTSDGTLAWGAVHSLPAATSLTVTGSAACVSTRDGRVYCWGNDSDGAAPNGAPDARPDAVAVQLPTAIQ